MQYRRTRIKGAAYFFRVNLANRTETLLTDNIDILRSTVREVKRCHPFKIDAMMVLPDHLHVVWTLPPHDDACSTRWMLIKAGFSRRIPYIKTQSQSQISKGERGIWQRRYWEHLIRDEQDFIRHVNYIHYNPVKHGHAKRPVDWPHSSIHRYISERIIPANWGADMTFGDAGFGES